jgi:tetratricopeptide (TPR) repeat protein
MNNRNLRFLLLVVAGSILVSGQFACRHKNKNVNNANVPVAKKSLVPPGLDAPAYFNLGMDATKHDRDEEAAEAFENAVKLQPEFPEAHLRLGMSYDVLDRPDDAKKEYKLAIDQYKKKTAEDGKDPNDWFNLGMAYNKSKRYDEAVGAFGQATRLKKDFADAYFELGDTLIKVARYADAVNALKKAVELDPDNYEAKDALDKATEGQQRIDSEVQQQKGAGKRNRNANTGADNANTGTGGGNSNSKPKPAAKP